MLFFKIMYFPNPSYYCFFPNLGNGVFESTAVPHLLQYPPPTSPFGLGISLNSLEVNGKGKNIVGMEEKSKLLMKEGEQ